MMTAAGFNRSLSSGTTQPSNEGIRLLLLAVVAVPIGVVLYRVFVRKGNEDPLMHESAEQRSERLAAVREKRLQKVKQEKQEEDEVNKNSVLKSQALKDTRTSQVRRRRSTASDSKKDGVQRPLPDAKSIHKHPTSTKHIKSKVPYEAYPIRWGTSKTQESQSEEAEPSPEPLENNAATHGQTVAVNKDSITSTTTPAKSQDDSTLIVAAMDGGITSTAAAAKSQDDSSQVVADKTDSVTSSSTIAKAKDNSALKQTKKKKRKRLFSPTQLLCEALSHIFRRNVTVESNAEAGTWGGEGWSKRPSEYPTASTITISLFEHKPDTIENEWEALADVFSKLLDDHLQKELFPSNDVRLAAMCHSRASAMSRHGFALVMTSDECFKELKACVDILSMWMAKQVAKWIRPEVQAASKDVEAATEELGDLFSADYGGDSAISYGGTATEIGPLEALFVLLQEAAAPVITVPFLEDLFRAYEEESTNDQGGLAGIFLSYALKRVSSSKRSQSFSSATLAQRVSAYSSILTSPSVGKALASAMRDEIIQMKDKNGHDIQMTVQLASLLEASAFVIPNAGDERSDNHPFFHQLEQVENFPLSTFIGQGKDVGMAMGDGRRTMKIAQTTAISSLRIAFKFGGKEQTFQWLSDIIRSNESLLRLLKLDLLESGGLVALSASRDFLLGTAWTLVGFCHSSLSSRLATQGADAFDVSYLSQALEETCQEQVTAQNRLFQTFAPEAEAQVSNAPTEFPGATRFFFLSSLMLRVALYPMLRMEEEFNFRYRKVIDAVQGAALADERPRSDAFKSHSPFIAAWLGWKTFLENPEFASCMTEMSLIQLGWLTALARQRGDNLSNVPEWMCRNPARWLSHLARMSPRSLKPQQAEKAVEYVTALLDLAVAPVTETPTSRFGFSPRVVTSLIEVVSSFVRAGVNRARRKERYRGRAGNDDAIDERSLDIYSSFDRDDLGVTVFTHPDVKQRLCPILLRTFLSVESAEGVDADIDSFSKLSAQSQIAELLTRLWRHPSGECRESVASLPASHILSFVSSLSTVALLDLNFGTEAIEKAHMTTDPRAASQAAGGLLGMRSLLGLLCALSQDDRVSACLGSSTEHASKLSNFFLQFLETLTSSDGATNQSLEEEGAVSTSKTLESIEDLSPAEKKRLVEDVVGRRIRAKKRFGLDVSVTCHQVLALAAKWHLTAAGMDASEPRETPFLSLLAANDDCDMVRMSNVYRRLVNVPLHIEGSEVDNAVAIFDHDGFVDHTPWEHKYEEEEDSEPRHENRYTVNQDQMNHADVADIASNEDIQMFIADLGREVSNLRRGQRKEIDPSETASARASIFRRAAKLKEDDYGSCLSSEWVVSSSPFRGNSNDSRLLHKYDKAARTRGVQAPVRLLVKEARKLHKTMPQPSADSAIFVCFAEERMDLCRVVVSGPVSTPYAHGLFEFDVFFPPSYPQVPPLVTFMTTGGGRVRFNPNLYTDGKVCISLLGVTTASDESQRWNPKVSSLAQLMITIQAQILGVADPYFNEGNGVPESMRHTSAGRAGSAKYNNRVRLETLRCAMIEQLRSPPKGFEEVIIRHFAMCRQRIVAQARRWMLEARGTDIFPKYERAYAELLSLLDTEAMRAYEALPPLDDDLQVLESLDPSFVHMVNGSTNTSVGGDCTETTDLLANRPDFNPWAAGSTASQIRNSGAQARKDDESDDEMYI